MTPKQQTIVFDKSLDAIPEPAHLRWVIGMRYAEILVLKKLLRAAEARKILYPMKIDGKRENQKP